MDLKDFLKKKELLLNKKEHQHHKHIENIYHHKFSGVYIGDFVYGGNDGLITTFSVAAGALGASFPPSVVLVLGFANIIADGLSMGIGSYLSHKSEIDYQIGQRKKEEWEIENLRPIEVEEIRQIYQGKGFTGKELDMAVNIITRNKKVWVEEMMVNELGIVEDNSGNSVKHGLATFISFILAGLIPLSAFLIGLPLNLTILLAVSLTAIALFAIGAFRQLISPVKWYRGGLENLTVGGLAAATAYFIGNIIEKIVIK